MVSEILLELVTGLCWLSRTCHSAVQCGAMRCSVVQCGEVRLSVVRCSVVYCLTLWTSCLGGSCQRSLSCQGAACLCNADSAHIHATPSTVSSVVSLTAQAQC
jgi:hypothetical protein